jgi:hypothetical protein
MVRYGLFLLIVVLAGANAVAAPAPMSCDAMVAGLQSFLQAHPQISGTRRQTKTAQLNHQPTRDSVAKAEQESRENLVAMLAKARAQQGAGDMKGCLATLAEIEWMLKP